MSYDQEQYNPIPVQSVNQAGDVIKKDWKVSFTNDGDEIETYSEKDGFGNWKANSRLSDGYGQEEKAAVSGKHWTLTLGLGILIAIWRALIYVNQLRTSRKYRAAVKDQLRQLNPGYMWNSNIMDAALARYSKNVLKALAKDSVNNTNVTQILGDPEGGFLFGLMAIYIMKVSAFVKKNGINENDKDALTQAVVNSHDQGLENMDSYSATTGRYLAEEIVRGGGGNSRYQVAGVADPHIWDKLETYFKEGSERMRMALNDDIQSSFATDRMNTVAGEYSIPTGTFNVDHFKAFVKKEGFDPLPTESSSGFVRTWKSFTGFGMKAIHPWAFGLSIVPTLSMVGLLMASIYSQASLLSWLETAAPLLKLVGPLT
ncbi:MAG: hypothetical protein HQL15_10805, partial [Candidatus Omnitrophica bacterium]|nr:hypothetical protein [Candidatus Omnitrophota bacterium]